DWNLEFKYLADQGITGKSIIIATGSSAVKLKEKGELLPGRGLEGNEYYIKPLSFRDFALQSIKFIRGILPNNELRDSLERLEENLNRTSIDLSLDLQDIQQEIANLLPFKNEVGYLLRKYLITGGLPRVINHYFENWREEFKEYINPVIAEIYIRDILGDIAKIDRQEIIARKLLKAILNKYGSRFSFNALARQTGRSHVTTIDYFDHFQESFICFILYAYDFNKNFSKLKGDKKIYFFDPFILHAAKSYLQGEEVQTAITRTLQDEEIQSQVLEGIVVSHLLLHREIPYVRSGQTFLWNYYNKSGKEVDAIIKLNGGYLGVEVKYQSHVDRRDIQRIKEVKDYIILSKEDTDNTDNLIISPLDIFLALITQSEKNL
ncbi:MAG: DUF4143 domain-containing protein, partial [Candidatus Auribacterota bacterium]|nr:DUF4143 domain-containing protein [Candidatus Auribacterota bacterium]